MIKLCKQHPECKVSSRQRLLHRSGVAAPPAPTPPQLLQSTATVNLPLSNLHLPVQIVVLDKLDYCATLNNLSEVRNLPNFRFVKGDIQSADLVVHILETEEIDTVMHFAAQTHVDNSFGNSLAFTMNNT